MLCYMCDCLRVFVYFAYLLVVLAWRSIDMCCLFVYRLCLYVVVLLISFVVFLLEEDLIYLRTIRRDKMTAARRNVSG